MTSSSGSYSVLLSWSGGVCWVLLWPTCEIFAGRYPSTRGRSSLCSLEWGVLFVPFARTSTRQTSAFSVVCPSTWNGLPLALRLLHRVHSHTFGEALYKSLHWMNEWMIVIDEMNRLFRREVDELQKRVVYERDQYQASAQNSNRISAIPKFSINDKFMLSREDGCYLLSIEVQMAIDNVLIQVHPFHTSNW